VNSGQDTDNPAGSSLTLRLALEVSNGTVPVSSLSPAIQAQISGSLSYPAPNLITFAIPTTDASYQSLATGRWTIEATKSEPTITSPVFIDASTQSGSLKSTAAQNLPAVFNANSTLQLDGYFAAPTAPATTVDGLEITAGNSTIFGLIVTGFSGYGITISGSSAHSDGIYGSFIGTVPDYPNGVAFLHPGAANTRGDGNLLGGIRIQSSNNFVGDDTPADRNVIANNGNVVTDTGAGVQIDSTSATGNLVENSLILGNVAQGVLIQSSNNTIGDSNGGYNYISGNGMQGILIQGNASTNVQGNLVLGCQIGTYNDPSSPSSFAILPNGSLYVNSSLLDQAPSFAAGIDIENSAKNTLGGLLPAARNYIAANYGDGVTINGSQSTANRLLNNWIGFDEYLINPGQVSLDAKVFYFPNQNGVSITAPGNYVGDGEAAGLNVISNNSFEGLVLSGSTATRNVVSGDIIGLDPTGTYKIGNDVDGLLLENAPGNTIGGTTSPAGNTISGNNQGIVIDGAGSTGNLVEGNRIGTGLDGVTPLGNANNGIWINGATSNTIGGTTKGAGNTISANNVGVSITDASSPSSPASFNILQGNFIGTDTTSTVSLLGNAIDGVYVSASNNTIGGTTTGAGNAIAYNGGVGVEIEKGIGDAIRGNNIFSNVGSINNIGDGSSANAGGGIYLDPANNANNQLAAPSPIAAAPDTTGINVQGSYLGQPNTTYSFDFFASSSADISGFGQGALYLGTSTVTTNGSGLAQINADFVTTNPIPSGYFISGTVTDLSGNTSAFSTNVVAAPVQVNVSSATYSVNEAQGTATITVLRSGNLAGIVTVGYATSALTSTPGVDYTDVFGTLTFAAGITSQSFTVPLLDPYKPLGSNTFKVTLSNPTGGATIGSTGSSTVTIIDNDLPNLSLSSPTYTVDQNGGTLTVTVTRNAGVGTSVVNYATTDGTAKAGVNYTATSGTLTFLPGVTSLSFNVPMIDDHLIHAPLTFSAGLSAPTGGNLAVPSTAIVTEVDNDLITYFSSSTYSVNQNGGGVIVTVTRNDTTTVSNVNYSTSDGTAKAGVNYTATSGTLDFPIGVATQTFTVPVIDDDLLHNALTFNVALSTPSVGALGTPASAVVTENDTDAQISFTADSFSGPQNGGFIAVSVTRSLTTSISTVKYATSDGTGVAGTNYTATSGTLSFPIGVATETIDIPIIDDNLIHSPDLNFNIALSNPTGGGLVAHNVDVVTLLDTDPILFFTSSTYSVNQNGGGVIITVTRSNTTATSTVNYSTADITAIAGVNYKATSGTLGFAIGIASQSFTVPMIDDNMLHGPLTFSVMLSNQHGAALGTPSSAIVTENDTDPQISFTSASFSGAQNSGSIPITVTRTNSDVVSTVHYATSDGTAIAGINYTATSGTVTFPIGALTETIDIPVIDDNKIHGPLTFSVALSNSTGGGLVTPSTALVTENDTDPTMSFSGTPYAVNQNAGSITITVTRSFASQVASTVQFSTSDGSAKAGVNYTTTTGTLTFGPGDLSETFSVPILDDGLIHGPLGFSVNLSNSTGGGLSSPSSAVVTINDTDPTVSFTNTPYVVAQNAGSITISVGRAFFSSFTNSVTTVHFSTSDGTAKAGVNYTATSGTLTFAPNDQTETFSVPVIDDSMIHGSLSFNVSLSNATGGGISNPSTAVVTLTDTDPTMTFSAPTFSGNQNAGSIVVTVSRAFLASVASTVQYTTSDGTAKAGVNYLPMSGTLTFTSTVTTQSIAIPVIDDNKIHGPLTFNVTLSNPNGGGIASPSIAVVTINDTDPQISFPSTSFSFNQNAGSGTVTVRRDTTTVISTVHYSTADGTAKAGVNYAPVSGVLTFPVGVATETFDVPVIDDNQIYGPLTFNVLLSNPGNGGLIYPSTAAVVLNDTDARIGFSTSNYVVTQNENGGTATISVVRTDTSNISTVDVTTVNGTAKAGVNYLTVAGFLTFPVGVSTVSFTVPVLNDNLIHAPLTFFVALSNATGGGLAQPSISTVSIIDKDNAGSFNLGQTAFLTSPGWNSVTVPVQRTGGSAGTATVSYTTLPGTGLPGVDYQSVSNTLTFAPGVTVQNIVVPLLNTTVPGPDKTFSVVLTSAQVGSLGTILTDQIQIQHPLSPFGTTPAGVAPSVTGINVIASAGGITAVQFTFSQPMDPGRASNPASYGYFFIVGGVASPQIQSASYNPATRTATVFPASPLPLGVISHLVLNAPNLVVQGVGLTNTSGVYLASNQPGTPSYLASFEAGRRLGYQDSAGNLVSLGLAGPGTMALALDPSDNVMALELSGTVPRRTTLSGQLKATRPGGGATSIPVITGASGVKVTLRPPHFLIGGISASAVDSLSVSGGLTARRRFVKK
jgi:hypothetical protein